MNERFEKIAVEVFFDESTNEPGQKMYTFGELKMQKFAELIVRECLDCSNNLANHYIDNHSEKEQTLLLASIADYSNEIRKQFGVAE